MFEVTKEEYKKYKKEFKETYIGENLYQASMLMKILLAILTIGGLIFFYNFMCVNLIKEIGNLTLTEITMKNILPLLFFIIDYFIIFTICLVINNNIDKKYFSAFKTFTERKK